MHCDDKRTLFVLKKEIEKTWAMLKKSDFQDSDMHKKLNKDILDYAEYKNSS